MYEYTIEMVLLYKHCLLQAISVVWVLCCVHRNESKTSIVDRSHIACGCHYRWTRKKISCSLFLFHSLRSVRTQFCCCRVEKKNCQQDIDCIVCSWIEWSSKSSRATVQIGVPVTLERNASVVNLSTYSSRFNKQSARNGEQTHNFNHIQWSEFCRCTFQPKIVYNWAEFRCVFWLLYRVNVGNQLKKSSRCLFQMTVFCISIWFGMNSTLISYRFKLSWQFKVQCVNDNAPSISNLWTEHLNAFYATACSFE